MTTSTVMNHLVVTDCTGNRVTGSGETFGSSGLGTLTIASVSAKKADLQIVGDIHGFLRFPFADPDSPDGMLMPSELRTMQAKLTQGGAGAVVSLLAEELYAY